MGRPKFDKDYSAEMRACTTGEEAFDTFSDCAADLGFPKMSYTYAALKRKLDRKNDLFVDRIVTIRSNLPEEAEQFRQNEYNERRLLDNDPTLLPFHEGNLDPYFFGLEYYKLGMIEVAPHHLKTLEEIANKTFAAVIIFPLMTPEITQLPSGSITVFSDLKGQALIEATQKAMPALSELVDIFAEKTEEVTLAHITRHIGLTPRETECLQFIANGFRTIDIADRLNLSKSMVDRHVASARKKLRALTVAQAVQRGLHLKLITA